jgi:hypothetical protein
MDNNPEVIARIKFIGRLQKGEKINTRRYVVQSDGLITRLIRTFWEQDNRSNTLSFLQETIRSAFRLLEQFDKANTKESLSLKNLLLQDLKSVVTGLANIKFTYVKDVKFCCDVDTLLELVVTKLGDNYIDSDYNFESNEIEFEPEKSIKTD